MPQIPIKTAAQQLINKSGRLELTERDSLHVLDLLDNPPAPNDKLIAAAFALPNRSKHDATDFA